jgi:hypothetical protein
MGLAGRAWRRRRSGSASYWHVRPGEGAGNPAQPAGAHMRARPSPALRRPRSIVKRPRPQLSPDRADHCLGAPRPYLPRRIATACSSSLPFGSWPGHVAAGQLTSEGNGTGQGYRSAGQPAGRSEPGTVKQTVRRARGDGSGSRARPQVSEFPFRDLIIFEAS